MFGGGRGGEVVGVLVWLATEVTGPLPSAPEVGVDPRVACALSLTRSQLRDSPHIAVLGQSEWLGGFLQAADVPVTLLRLDDPVPVNNLQTDVVFLLSDGPGNRSLVERTLTLRVVAWWRTGDAQVAVDAAREVGMVRVAVVSGPSGAQQVFGYREVCEGGAVLSRMVLAGHCGPTGELQANGDVFPDLQRWNLQGCPLRMTLVSIPPFVDSLPLPGGGWGVGGTFAPLAYALAKRVNATLDVIDSGLDQPFGGILLNGTPYGAAGEVILRRRDVYFTTLFHLAHRDGIVDLNPSVTRTCLTLVVPSGLGDHTSPFKLLYDEFSPVTWALVGAAFVAVVAVLAVTWWGASVHPVQDAAFFALSAMLGNSFVAPASTGRLLTVYWFVFCMVLGTAYQAARHSLEAAPKLAPEINTLDRLVQSGLQVLGTQSSIDELHRLVRDEDGNATLRVLGARTELGADLDVMVHRMVTRKDVAIYYSSFVTRYWGAVEEKARGRKLVHELDYCGTAAQLSYFMTRRGSCLAPAIVDLVTRAMDIGLIQYLDSQFQSEGLEPNDGWSRLGLDKLSAAFQLLLFGLALGGLAVTSELLVHKSLLRVRSVTKV